ncbi:MAG: transporter substrate-binding domain-containing protein [Ruminococcaceae bacterium]|nr:transporter substrate-binding domain-containing protein [Oscillospiraceae bacterium]
MKKVFATISLILAVVMCLALFAGCSGDTAKYVVLEENFGAEEYAIGFRKTDNAFALRVQEIIDEMIADGKAGEISEKWFGEDVMLRNVDFPAPIEDIGDDSLQKILDKGYMILGLDENFPPMGFRDETGTIVGFDIDLATEVAARLGVRLEIQPIDWNAKEMELNDGKIDMIWNGMSITPARVEEMNMSKPYIANRQIIIVSEDSGIKTKADLAGKKVAAQAGSSAIDAMQADAETFASFGDLVEFDNNNAAYLDLKVGRVDAFVVDEVVGKYMISQDAE